MIILWIKRIVFSSKNIFHLKVFLSLAGLILSVSCLAVTMTVMSSYEATLRQTLVEYSGHLIVLKRKEAERADSIFKKIKPFIFGSYSYTPFTSVEALALSKGSLSGVLVEGVDVETVDRVLNLKARLTEGQFLKEPDSAVIGLDLAERLGLKTGSSFSLAVPQFVEAKKDRTPPLPKLKTFSVAGVVDMGRYDYNSRYVGVSLVDAQKLMRLSNKVMGFKLRFKKESSVLKSSRELRKNLSSSFWVRDYRSISKNLFSAIEMEKTIIFFVLLVLVIAAGFNVSNQLMIDVLKRFKEIGILKTMGAGPSLIARLFICQCLMVSLIGVFLGCFLGVFVSYSLTALYDVWGALAPSDIYKLNKIQLDFRWRDFFMIFLFSLVICLIGAWIPIKKAFSLSPKEGLSYE